MTESKLITHRRNFLVRALGFTAAGAAVSVPIVTVASADERLRHHLAGALAAMRDLYPTADVRLMGNCLEGAYHRDFIDSITKGDLNLTPAHVGITAWAKPIS